MRVNSLNHFNFIKYIVYCIGITYINIFKRENV